MRETILFILGIFIAGTSVAQPVLNAADFGTNISAKVHTVYGISNMPADYNLSGPDHVWDFASMSTEDVTAAIISVPLNYISNISNFPEATYCERIQQGNNFNYKLYTVTPNAYKLIGASMNQNGPTLGTMNQDLYYLNTTQMSADYEPLAYSGYGTLITPFETFTNVVCLHVSSFDPFGGGITNRYRWITTNPYRHIMEAVTGGMSYYIYYEYVPYALGLNTSHKDDFFIFPNPTQRDFTIHIESTFNNDSFVTVYDILGKALVNHEKLNTNFNNISLQDFSPGLYVIKITDNENQVLHTEKIIKE